MSCPGVVAFVPGEHAEGDGRHQAVPLTPAP
ncbi:hypothetical protein GA0115246_103285, partial [Streptomyces sp. SolWspMP-sol7th]